MDRIALDYIKNWYQKGSRKPLIIRGARQVGKSYLVREFAKQETLSLLEINFEKTPEIADLFDKRSIQKTCEFLEIHYKVRINPKTTLIFLDEIQAAPQVIPVLRYFYEERPDLCIIAAGSLLEFVLKDSPFPMPVGRVEFLYLGPMTFEEFLKAQGESNLLQFLQEYRVATEAKGSIPAPIHQQLMDHIRTYCMTGGMPEAVKSYFQNSWEGCEAVQNALLSTYQDDFSKYRHRVPDLRLRKIFQKIPRLIGEKLKFVNIDPLERAKDLNLALDLLCMAGVGHRIYHSSANGVPLGAEIDPKFFKLLFLDVGLVSSICGLNRLDFEKKDTNLVNEGKITEQFIGQHLLFDHARPDKAPELHYWAREKRNASAEIDYVVSQGAQVLPIEVKSAKSGSLRSLHLFLKEKNLPLGIRFNSEPPSVLEENNYTLLSLPFYLVGQMGKYVAEVLRKL